MPTQSERKKLREKELKEKIELVLAKLAARGITGEAYDEIAKQNPVPDHLTVLAGEVEVSRTGGRPLQFAAARKQKQR